ncbi:hypothetical protein BD289DRAFT_371436 [Coniella lustricola]|uniref:Transferase family-domain-containing protein n=1 Tax=Coniella lustricola TaxID=2025994 RepID=A0A2T3A3M8_9PEZI|nr:hypothetical protein BD289DRAFT_371436 [Coniella lustricola]
MDLRRIFSSWTAGLGLTSTTRDAQDDDQYDVYPVHMLDDTEGTRNYMVGQTLVFNDVLDAERLHDSLSRLLEIGDWRKFGGRIRFKDGGRLEIHSPKYYNAERPAVFFTHDVSSFEISIKDHDLARELPKPTQEPSIQRGADDFRSFAARTDIPTNIEDMVQRSLPLLSLHITSFNDATLVGLAWPHILMDAVGIKALLTSWSRVLCGEDEMVPAVLGAHNDVLYDMTDETDHNFEVRQESFFVKNSLNGLGLIIFIIRHLWTVIWYHGFEKRTIYLPKSKILQIQESTRLEAAEAAKIKAQESCFISEADILMAWAAEKVIMAEAQSKPVTIMAAVNVRFRLSSVTEKITVNHGGVYLQNMVLACFACLPTALRPVSCGAIALECRRLFTQQTTEEEMLKLLRVLRKMRDAGKEAKMPLCGQSDALLILWNDLSKIDLLSAANFSAAVLTQNKSIRTGSNAPGTMEYHHLQRLKPNYWVANTFTVLGKDHHGGCWIMGLLSPKVWERFHRDFQ